MPWLASALLSSRADADLLSVNPFLSAAQRAATWNALAVTLLRGARIALATLCLAKCAHVAKTLDQVRRAVEVRALALGAGEGVAAEVSRGGSSGGGGGSDAQLRALVIVLQKSAGELAAALGTRRAFTTTVPAAGGGAAGEECIEFDPRLLIFEFQLPFMLRARQYQMVREFVQCARGGESGVKQMIMGAGAREAVTRPHAAHRALDAHRPSSSCARVVVGMGVALLTPPRALCHRQDHGDCAAPRAAAGGRRAPGCADRTGRATAHEPLRDARGPSSPTQRVMVLASHTLNATGHAARAL